MFRSVRPRAASAFTMVEMAVVLVVGSIMLLLILHWVLGLVAVASDANQRQVVQRDALALTSNLGADLAQAQSCSPTGAGPVLDFLAPYNSATNSQSFGVFTLNDATATPSDPALVIWTFTFDPNNPATLVSAERTDLGPISAGCPSVAPPASFDAATNTATEVVAAGATAPSGVGALSVTHVSGLGGVSSGYTGSCVDSAVDMLNCNFTAVSFDFVLRSPSGVPVLIDSALPLSTASTTW